MFGRKKKRPTRRPAVAGEVCLCGNPAEIVLDDPRLGPAYGSCLARYEHPRFGPCPFCSQHTRHATAADCPSYRLSPDVPAAAESAATAGGAVHHYAAGEVRSC